MTRHIRHGIDQIEVDRIEKAISIFDKSFLNRIYTSYEIKMCKKRRNEKNNMQLYAAYWAAKEATMKALGTGYRQGVRFRDIEIRHKQSKEQFGKPYLVLYGKAKEIANKFGVEHMEVSISHLEDKALASVIFS